MGCEHWPEPKNLSRSRLFLCPKLQFKNFQLKCPYRSFRHSLLFRCCMGTVVCAKGCLCCCNLLWLVPHPLHSSTCSARTDPPWPSWMPDLSGHLPNHGGIFGQRCWSICLSSSPAQSLQWLDIGIGLMPLRSEVNGFEISRLGDLQPWLLVEECSESPTFSAPVQRPNGTRADVLQVLLRSVVGQPREGSSRPAVTTQTYCTSVGNMVLQVPKAS